MGEYAVPLTMGGIGALGGALGSGSAGEDITGFRTVAGLDPQGLLSQAMRGLSQYGGVATNRAGMDVNVPVNVQSLPQYAGPGMAAPVGVMAHDPALWQPGVRGVPGIQFASPNVGTEVEETPEGSRTPWGRDIWMFPDAPRGDQRTALAQDPGVQTPTLGAAPSEAEKMMSALEMMGVGTDPSGNMTAPRTNSIMEGATGQFHASPTTGPSFTSTDYWGNPILPGEIQMNDPANWDVTPQLDQWGNPITEFGGDYGIPGRKVGPGGVGMLPGSQARAQVSPEMRGGSPFSGNIPIPNFGRIGRGMKAAVPFGRGNDPASKENS